MAARFTCGAGALLSHQSAAELWGIRPSQGGLIHVSVPSPRDPRRRGIRVHRRKAVRASMRNGIPLTDPRQTIVDIAPRLTERELERAIGEADKLGLANPQDLTESPRIRDLLTRRALLLTDSELESLFVPIALDAGLSRPVPQATISGFKVDFWFEPENLVVETDGLTYHRTTLQQKRDRIRDQLLTAAGFRVLRFTHEQVKYERDHVADVLRRL